MRAIRFGLAVAVVAAAGAFSATALADSPTSVTITGQNGDYHGKVKSPDNDCEAGRTVKVYKIKHGVSDKIGDDTSESNGDWSIGNSGFKHGKFYAKVKASSGCESATSDTIKR